MMEKRKASMDLISPNFSDLFQPNLEIGKFPDGDSHVRILELAACRGQQVTLYHRLYPDQNNSLMELFLILETLKQENAQVTLVAPYLPYARQDKKKLDGEVASAIALCNLLAQAGCKKLVTFDCHFLNATGLMKFGNLNIENLSMGAELIARARQYFAGEPFEVAAPDAGANYLVKDRGGKAFKKVRKEYDGDKVGYRDVETMECNFDIKGKNFLILDDMISTGATMQKALERLLARGAKKVFCAATHGLFLYNSVDKLRKFTEHVFASDTITGPQAEVSIKTALQEFKSNIRPLF
jgi:ribose-phosphate pyrophosphokinase